MSKIKGSAFLTAMQGEKYYNEFMVWVKLGDVDRNSAHEVILAWEAFNAGVSAVIARIVD